MSWELRALTAINRSPLNAVVTTLERPGAHWAVQVRYANLTADQRARLQAFISSTRGAAQRFYVPVYGWTRRGSFPATELFTNNLFENGTTGWTANSTTHTVSDGIARLTVPTPGVQSISQSITMVQYAPYALRSILHDGRGTAGISIGRFINAGAPSNSDYSTARGLGTIVKVNVNASSGANFPAVINATSGIKAGDYLECSYASLARCALVDNGPNSTLFSDQIDNAAWTKSETTVTADASAAPDGTSTADALVESSATSVHSLSQSFTRPSAAADICAFGYFQRGSGTRDVRVFTGDIAGGNYAGCTFNLGAGTAGTVSLTGTATNGRAFIAAAGGGWYYCAVVVRTPASTNARVTIEMVSSGVTNYAGDGTSSIRVWRLGGALSGVPTRGMQTTSAGYADGIAQTGGALYLKGLPASTNGLLLQGDPAEIITGSTSQLVRTRSPLNSDAAGLGYFEFEPPLRISPSDNAAVIIHNPMCRMMMESNVNGWTDRLGGFADLEFTAVEDVSP
jgi:hypothetical protein